MGRCSRCPATRGTSVSSIYLSNLSMASWLIAQANGAADGERKRSVTQGSARVTRILRAVGITNLDPDSTAAKPTKAA